MFGTFDAWYSAIVASPERVAALAGVISSIAAAVAAIFAFHQVKVMGRQGHLAEQAAQAQVFLNISDKWSNIYRTRLELLRRSMDVEAIKKEYPDIQSYLASEHWSDLRTVGGFYEFIGTLVKRKYLPLDVVLDLVNVDPQLWRHVFPVIAYLRADNFPQLYENWEYLVCLSAKNKV